MSNRAKLFVTTLQLEFILGSLPWENQDDKEIILQCKQALQPWLESRPEVPATLKTILAYLGTLGLMHEPEYDQLHKWLQEMKVANNFTQLDWAIPTDFK